MEKITVKYNDKIVSYFVFAALFWGIIAMLAGVLAASQMAFWQLNFDSLWLSFGRTRPLHTNAIIFAFVGNFIFAGIYHSSQRLLKARLASDLLSKIHFWGWQLIIIVFAFFILLGRSQAKEYAEAEWPIDLMIAIIWVIFAINFFWTLARRNEKNLYVAIWFYIASILTVAVLHIVNNLAIPISWTESVPVFAGAQDALLQWWYGHNAVAFFLTTPVLGIMYYYVPKAVNRPVYSYRLSIVHFWSLIFIYIWAGPHHLLNTALPDWLQSLGMIFSIMLWAPSWGGMINGLLTIRQAWDKLRTDPVVKFFAAGITFYGMSTFEGPLLSIKAVSQVGHYNDWIIGHVHSGGLGWNGFMAAAVFYWLVPKLYGVKLYSTRMANFHFWVGIFAILIYVVSMYVNAGTQHLMWTAINPVDGTLVYSDFNASIIQSNKMYLLRLLGGLLYVSSMSLMVFNLIKTARSGSLQETQVDVLKRDKSQKTAKTLSLLGHPLFLLIVVGILLSLFFTKRELGQSVLVYSGLAVVVIAVTLYLLKKRSSPDDWHHKIEGKPFLFSFLSLLAILIGGLVEIVPSVIKAGSLSKEYQQTPYTALELAGRRVYLRNGCYYCHSQMIRPFLDEKLRYGDASEAWESMYDRPFQWGSKRTGPDLARVGKKYSDVWHYNHMIDPRKVTSQSIMPSYADLEKNILDLDLILKELKVHQMLGVPYPEHNLSSVKKSVAEQSQMIIDSLKKSEIQFSVTYEQQNELIAIIAYLQKLGLDKKKLEQ